MLATYEEMEATIYENSEKYYELKHELWNMADVFRSILLEPENHTAKELCDLCRIFDEHTEMNIRELPEELKEGGCFGKNDIQTLVVRWITNPGFICDSLDMVQLANQRTRKDWIAALAILEGLTSCYEAYQKGVPTADIIG